MKKAIVAGAALSKLVANHQLRQALPCLASQTSRLLVKKQRPGCSACNKKIEVMSYNPADQQMALEIKKCLYRAQSDIHNIAKGILGVDQLVFYFPAGDGLPPRVSV